MGSDALQSHQEALHAFWQDIQTYKIKQMNLFFNSNDDNNK